MPWRGPAHEKDFPTLGYQVFEWAQTYFQVPDGPLAGTPLTLTNEQALLLLRFYQLDDVGKFVIRRAAVRRAQGWGKSPLLGMIALAELAGPVRFDGWDAYGEPVGVPMLTPWVQVAASSEDQAGNTYNALYEMAARSELNGTKLDVGKTKIFLSGDQGSGQLEPVSASAGTRLGQRVTFAVLDETHLWTKTNGGLKLANVIRRNAGKMNGRTFESTNAHEPGEDSVAERTYEAWKRGAPGLLYDSVESPYIEDLTDHEAVMAGLKVAYGDARWVDLERIASEIEDPGTDPEDARRFYFNQLVKGTGRPVDIEHWRNQLAKPEIEVARGSYIGVGFDGSINDDSTCLYGCTEDGHIFEIETWEKPEGPGQENWHVPRLEVNAKVNWIFQNFRVGRMLCDPPKWWTEIETWAARWPDYKRKPRVIALDTFSARRFAPVCGRLAISARESTITHDGGEGLTAHLAACSKKRVRINDPDDKDDGRSQFVIVKSDTRKIDRAVAAALALEAAKTMERRGSLGREDDDETLSPEELVKALQEELDEDLKIIAAELEAGAGVAN